MVTDLWACLLAKLMAFQSTMVDINNRALDLARQMLNEIK